ncbi:uncharacterized protein si:ch211-243a20.3 [Dunckerocampus dactyliophorus]|uniref:uncharacterized protein si:ch211-243a20.3 n=1 Tax=Dunckerocampus dactyliophorus TaxID=161453 RepID=UPI002404CAB6|nr:uncharacterized protein si:ch211-243a20.3 [Dunckerocampus dactyliophorus]XP_054635536.1 uncharacterized protein si:ch211-243a20.3 [Dunckerocampus dactyliophorus]
MNPHWLLMVAAMATAAHLGGTDNELDYYGHWNYRDGADRVDVSSVRSLTKILDSWGKQIFKEIKTLLHSQPNTVLPDYSRVRPLSETINDLFREVSMLHRRITELSHRLATLEPFLRRHGYREAGDGDGLALARQSLTGEATSQNTGPGAVPKKGSRLVRRRRVKVFKKNGKVRVVLSGS